jgi:hypothetical protein
MKPNVLSVGVGIATGVLFGCSAESRPSEPAPRIATEPVRLYEGFAQPERVYFDEARDRYLVSNVDGEPSDKDNNGFISVLAPDGGVEWPRWIAGGEDDVTLHAPKGLTVVGEVLYVADIDVVRRFDVVSGAPLGDIPFPGATFLNGVSAAPDGRIYVSDSGPPQGTLDAVGTEAVYVLEGDEPRQLASGSLGRPTSLESTASGVFVASFGENRVRELDSRGALRRSSPLPAGGLAGVAQLGEWVYVTSWQASAIYRGKVGQPFVLARESSVAPSDLGTDATRGRLLVPHFTENTVEALEVR